MNNFTKAALADGIHSCLDPRSGGNQFPHLLHRAHFASSRPFPSNSITKSRGMINATLLGLMKLEIHETRRSHSGVMPHFFGLADINDFDYKSRLVNF
jgi:hypothetical protein